MARLPIYTQQYVADSRNANAADFGGIEGRAKQGFGDSLGELGSVIAGIELRKQNRQDTIERVRSINVYQQKADAEFARMQTEEDLTDTNAPKRYSEFLKTTRDAILEDHAGSQSSKEMLAVKLESYKGSYEQSLYREGVKSQFKMMGDYMGDAIKGLSDLAGDRPDTILIQFNALDEEIDKMSASLTPEQEEAYRETGRSNIIHSAVQTYLDSNDYNAADAVLSIQGVADTLSPDLHRQLKSKVISGQHENEKYQRQVHGKISAIESVYGPLTKAQKARVLGFGATTDKPTLSDRIAEAEVAIGRPLTPDQVAKMGNFHVTESNASGDFGSSLKGRSLNIMNDLAPGFAAGTLTPEQENVYMSAVNEYTQPIQYKNPDTQLFETRTARLPSFVEEAMGRRGLEVSTEGETVMPEDAGPEDVGFTWWDESDNVAGPQAVITEFGQQSLPFDAGISGIPAQRRKTLASDVNRLVSMLQQNPRYAEGERKQIKNEMDLKGGLMDNPAAFKTRLLAVDDSLAIKMKEAYDILQEPNAPKEVRQWAQAVMVKVPPFRARLGIPPKVSSRKEALEYPPGTEVILPDGSVGYVPESTNGE